MKMKDNQRRAMFAKLNPTFKRYKPFKTVAYNNPELRPISDGMATYKGELYGTKEDLKYMPKRVRLIRLNPSIPIKTRKKKNQ